VCLVYRLPTPFDPFELACLRPFNTRRRLAPSSLYYSATSCPYLLRVSSSLQVPSAAATSAMGSPGTTFAFIRCLLPLVLPRLFTLPSNLAPDFSATLALLGLCDASGVVLTYHTITYFVWSLLFCQVFVPYISYGWTSPLHRVFLLHGAVVGMLLLNTYTRARTLDQAVAHFHRFSRVETCTAP
jgi:hypothetical protein